MDTSAVGLSIWVALKLMHFTTGYQRSYFFWAGTRTILPMLVCTVHAIPGPIQCRTNQSERVSFKVVVHTVPESDGVL